MYGPWPTSLRRAILCGTVRPEGCGKLVAASGWTSYSGGPHVILSRSKLIEGDLHIDPMTSMALDKANRLLSATVPLLIWGSWALVKQHSPGLPRFVRLAVLAT